jgi:hypothetical protein
MKRNNRKHKSLYFDREKKLKITVALLVALSGILAGIAELFSNCGCCCINAVECDLCPVKIALLIVNVLAVITALIADIIGICEYGKIPTDDIGNQCYDCPYFEQLSDIEEYYSDDSDKNITLKAITETKAEKDKNAPDKRMSKQNRTFLCSLITTAISFALLCVSVMVIAVI